MNLAYWADLLHDTWGIKAELSRLDGEYDLNFLAQSATGDAFILKVMRPGCSNALVAMQIAAFEHIKSAAPEIPVPSVVCTLDGPAMAIISDGEDAPRTAWLLECLPGKCYAKAAPKTLALIHEVGAVLGGAGEALADFEFPGLERDFKWDLMQASWIDSELDSLTDPARQCLIRDIATDFAQLEPDLQSLPKQAIHNDANDITSWWREN